MRRIPGVLFAALVWLAPIAAAHAQGFADQATFAGTGAGSANAQTATIQNAFTLNDLRGVIIRYIPNVANTGATTLTVNGFAATNVLKVMPTGLANLASNELVPTVAAYLMYDGTQFQLLNPQSRAVHAGSYAPSALSYNEPPNITIAATVGANALTVTVQTAAAGTPTVGSPIPVLFRDPAGTGNVSTVNITAALTFTVAAGNTLGCTSAVLCRAWVVLASNAGTPQLCLYNATVTGTITSGILGGGSVLGIDESTAQNSAAGTNGGSSAQTFYCNASSLSGVPVRIIGYVEATETTGNWGSVSKIQLFGPGVKPPGSVIQTKSAGGASLAITPKSACNLVRASAKESALLGSSASYTPTLVRTATVIDTTSLANGATSGTAFGAAFGPILDNPATASSVTYSLSSSGGTGTPSNQLITLEEIQG